MRRVLHGKNLQYLPARRFKNNGKVGYESRRYISAFSENNNVGQAWVSGERWGGGLAACAGGTPVSPPVQWGDECMCLYAVSS
jgi:hypothetical protein